MLKNIWLRNFLTYICIYKTIIVSHQKKEETYRAYIYFVTLINIVIYEKRWFNLGKGIDQELSRR